MDVVRDVLDKNVVDRNGREMGRVDGIVLEQAPGEPPRLGAILIGPTVVASRVHSSLERIVRSVERWLGVEAMRPISVAWSEIDDIDRRVRLRLAIGDTTAAEVEKRLRRWLLRLPGT